MTFNKITAFFPPDELDRVEADLMALKVPGISVSHTHGFGRYKDFYAPDAMVDNVRIEIFSPVEETSKIVTAISNAIQQTTNCDGMIAVQPVSELIHLRRFA